MSNYTEVRELTPEEELQEMQHELSKLVGDKWLSGCEGGICALTEAELKALDEDGE